MNRLHPTAEQTGIAWYNRLTKDERAYWLKIADQNKDIPYTASAADAYRAFCRGADREGNRE